MSDSLPDQNAELVYQGIRLLRELPDDAYTAERRPSSEAPAIGPHVRHCLDFYVCFLDGMDGRVIDYDQRARRPEVERDREAAIAALAAVAERLARIEPARLAEQIEIHPEAAPADDRVGSTLGRELQFLASHTVHHYALIAVTLRLEGRPVPSEFGIAPSTLEHWRREGRVAR